MVDVLASKYHLPWEIPIDEKAVLKFPDESNAIVLPSLYKIGVAWGIKEFNVAKLLVGVSVV